MQVRHPEAHSFAWTQLHLLLSDQIEHLSTQANNAPDLARASHLRDMVAALQDALEALPISETVTAPSERLIPHAAEVLASTQHRLTTPGYAEGRAVALSYMKAPCGSGIGVTAA